MGMVSGLVSTGLGEAHLIVYAGGVAFVRQAAVTEPYGLRLFHIKKQRQYGGIDGQWYPEHPTKNR